MCSMLHNRYTKIKSCVSSKKDNVSQEITILQQLGVHRKEDKDHVPEYLKYHDEDHMYFPCAEPVDIAINKKVNDTILSQEGLDVLTAVVESLHSNPNLHSLLLIAAIAKVLRFENLSCTAVDTVFKRW